MPRLARGLDAAALAALLILCLPISLRKIETADLPWQLAAGREILATGAVPRIDRWSFLSAGRDWLDVHWLAQVLMAGAERLGGLVILQLGTFVLLVLALLAALRLARRPTSPGLEPPIAVLALAASWTRIEPRPDLLSILFPALTILLLEEVIAAPAARRRRAWTLGLLALQVAWSNLHGSFVLGVAIGIVYAASAWLERELAALRGPLAASAALAALACLLNPRGASIYTLFWPYIEAVAARLGLAALPPPQIQEWLPPFSARAGIYLGGTLGPYLALLGLALLALLAPGRALPPRRAAVLALFALLSLTALRNIAPFAFLALATIPAGLAGWLRRLPSTPREALRLALPGIGAIAALALAADMASNRYFVRRMLPTETGFGWHPTAFPEQACGWIEAAGIEGQAFHNYEVGGYYLWRFDRRRRAFLDGRLDLLAPAQMQRYTTAMGEPALFEELLVEGGVTHVLLKYATADAQVVFPYLESRRERWRRAFADGAGAVYLRADLPVAPAIAPTPAPEHPWDRALRRWLAPLERRQAHLPSVLLNLGYLHEVAGEYALAAKRFEQALGEQPGMVASHEHLAALHLRLGDRAAARKELDWLDREAPRSTHRHRLREQLERVTPH